MCQMINDFCNHKQTRQLSSSGAHECKLVRHRRSICITFFNNSCGAFSDIAIIILQVIPAVMASQALLANYVLRQNGFLPYMGITLQFA